MDRMTATALIGLAITSVIELGFVILLLLKVG
jgi:hypothetical protein